MRQPTFLALILASLLVRVIALPSPGTHDVDVWKNWSHAGSHDPIAVYGIGGTPPVRGTVRYGDAITTVDYPPMAIYELGLAGRLYASLHPDYPDTWRLTAAVKLPGLAAGLLLTAGLFLGVRRITGRREPAQWAALAYWLNPATILNGEVLGYLDPLVMAPAVGAFLLVGVGRPALGATSLAVALLTKPQALLVGPAFAIAVWHAGGVRAFARALAAGAATSALIVLPYALAGALPNMWLAFGSWSTRRDIMSAWAANLWWIVTWVTRAYYSIKDFGFPRAFLLPVRRILQISSFTRVGLPNPRPIAAGLLAFALAWGYWRARRMRDLGALAGLAAFTVHAFFVLSVNVHEHHMMLMVPLLALAAALRPGYRGLFYVVSAICALNMNLVYGIGMGWGFALPRTLTPIDATVVLAFANLLAFAWHCRVLAREAEAARLTPAGASAA
jgi:hypothetical protein